MSEAEVGDQTISEGMRRLKSKAMVGRIRPLCFTFLLQGGGAKGAFQGAVLAESIAGTDVGLSGAIGTSAGAINGYIATNSLSPGRVATYMEVWRRIAAPASTLSSLILGLMVATVLVALAAGEWGAVAAVMGSTIALVVLAKLVRWWLPGPSAWVGRQRSRLMRHIAYRRDRVGLVPLPFVAALFEVVLPSPTRRHHFRVTCTPVDASSPNFEASEVSFVQTPRAPNPPDEVSVYYESTTVRSAEARISVFSAIAASAGLPVFVRPLEAFGRRFLDGGMYANLPAHWVRTQAAMGADAIVCIIPVPIGEMKCHEFVDYRTLRFLHQLKADQLSATPLPSDGAATRRGSDSTPIFVLAPQARLRSGTVLGFFFPFLMKRDAEDGAVLGRSFSSAVTAFRNGQSSALEAFEITALDLPALPDTAPSPGWWGAWVNRSW